MLNPVFIILIIAILILLFFGGFLQFNVGKYDVGEPFQLYKGNIM